MKICRTQPKGLRIFSDSMDENIWYTNFSARFIFKGLRLGLLNYGHVITHTTYSGDMYDISIAAYKRAKGLE